MKLDPQLVRLALVLGGVAVMALGRTLLADVPEVFGAGSLLLGMAMRAPGDVRPPKGRAR